MGPPADPSDSSILSTKVGAPEQGRPCQLSSGSKLDSARNLALLLSEEVFQEEKLRFARFSSSDLGGIPGI